MNFYETTKGKEAATKRGVQRRSEKDVSMGQRTKETQTIMTTYQTLSERVKQSITVDELTARERQILRHYNNFTINGQEFKRLDLMIFERMAKLTA